MRAPELVAGCDGESIVVVPVMPVEVVVPVELVVFVVLALAAGMFIDVRTRSVIVRVRSTIASQLWRACSASLAWVCRI